MIEPERAVELLLEIKAELENNSVPYSIGKGAVLRKAEVVFHHAFSSDNDYSGMLYNSRSAESVIDTAIFDLQIRAETNSKSVAYYDEGLWGEVRAYFEKEEWSAVPPLVARYVEHQVREWSELQEDGAAHPLVGKELANRAFAKDGPLKLGKFPAETEGWQGLARGFFQALSNVDRHRIQKRADLREYAVGVLGIASLLLTQIRYQHPEVGD